MTSKPKFLILAMGFGALSLGLGILGFGLLSGLSAFIAKWCMLGFIVFAGVSLVLHKKLP